MPAMELLSPKSLVKSAACPLRPGEMTDYDPLLKLIGKARFALLGEASHAPTNSTGNAPRSPNGSSLRKDFRRWRWKPISPMPSG